MNHFFFETTFGTLLLQLTVSFLGSVAFALLFGVPKKYYVPCGLIGGVGWLLYCVLTHFEILSVTVATLLATLLVALMSRVAAVLEKCPVTVFLITGIFPLVPGAGVYWTVFYLVMGNKEASESYGFLALKAAIAIVIGIVLVAELPEKLFHLFTKDKSVSSH